MSLSAIIGDRLGSDEAVLASDGGSVACIVGSCEGAPVSPWPTTDGLSVARTVGRCEGQTLSASEIVAGLVEGASEGFADDSARVGTTEGDPVGFSDGVPDSVPELFTETGVAVMGNQSVELVLLAGLQHKKEILS